MIQLAQQIMLIQGLNWASSQVALAGRTLRMDTEDGLGVTALNSRQREQTQQERRPNIQEPALPEITFR